MKRGDLVTCAVRGDFGKPRPALVIQSDNFTTSSVTLLLLTGTLVDVPLLRVRVEPTEANGLRKPSHIMINRVTTLPRDQIGSVIGRLENEIMRTVEQHLNAFLGLLS